MRTADARHDTDDVTHESRYGVYDGNVYLVDAKRCRTLLGRYYSLYCDSVCCPKLGDA
jgi:hypothetical protein